MLSKPFEDVVFRVTWAREKSSVFQLVYMYKEKSQTMVFLDACFLGGVGEISPLCLPSLCGLVIGYILLSGFSMLALNSGLVTPLNYSTFWEIPHSLPSPGERGKRYSLISSGSTTSRPPHMVLCNYPEGQLHQCRILHDYIIFR